MISNLVDLYTDEGKSLPEIPWNVYPRPKLKRNSFFCLNGEWDFAETKSNQIPCEFNEKITVPFCPQSLLSGIHRNIPDDSYVYYKKSFSLTDGFLMDRVILHFGGVDQIADVYINGKWVCEHAGGYEHFSVDITDELKDKNEIIVRVKDNLDSKILPYGKQRHNRSGMWYTPVTGIWQTVWIESVPNNYIKNISTSFDGKKIKFNIDGVDKGTIKIDSENIKLDFINGTADVEIDNIKLWSPEAPNIYNFTVVTDYESVDSYFTARTLEIKNIDGFSRILLNGKPYFFNGLLDQGYWSDGIFTPASPNLFIKDIKFAKSLGFNTLRKHIKIEPDLFYYECDRLGIIVFQDMVNNSDYKYIRDTVLPTVGFIRKNDKHIHKNRNSRKAFVESMKTTVNALKEFSCICYWTIFNEGWGQFCSDEMYNKLKSIDTTRIIDSTSGWFQNKLSDVESLHIYFKKLKFKKTNRPVVISEFGGYSYKVPNHIFNLSNDYGYGKYKNLEEYQKAVTNLYTNSVLPLIKKGLCGAIFTQISDVEDEINGLITYDRKVEKLDSKVFSKIFNDINI